MSVEKGCLLLPDHLPALACLCWVFSWSSSSGGWSKNTQCMCRNALKFCSGPNTLLPCLNYDTFLFSGLWFFLSEPGYALWLQWKLKAEFWHVWAVVLSAVRGACGHVEPSRACFKPCVSHRDSPNVLREKVSVTTCPCPVPLHGILLYLQPVQ